MACVCLCECMVVHNELKEHTDYQRVTCFGHMVTEEIFISKEC